VREIDLTRFAPVDVFLFGFPCNDWSVVGERRGMQGVHGRLYLAAVKALRQLKPMAFVAENVGGLQHANDGQAIRQVLSDLERSGYTVTANLYHSELYGVPQARRRVLITGIRNDLGRKLCPPRPGTETISCRAAIENPPINPGIANNERVPIADSVRRRLELIQPGENVWQAQSRLGHDAFGDTWLEVKGARLSNIYRRLNPDQPSYTLTGSGGGGTHVYHWSDPRPLTNRERARLQTFPDDFSFHGNNASVRRQIGMAVPPMLAKVVAEALLKTVAGVPYDAVAPNINVAKGPASRGRPRRLEAAPDTERARAYRQRRKQDLALVASVVARALETGILPTEANLPQLVAFAERHLGSAVSRARQAAE
jgi:DNA (cytosine-5)-methyltransferase 1